MRTIKLLKNQFLFATILLLSCVGVQAQVTIGGNTSPATFSVLELMSNNTRGLRLPQLTTIERNALQNSAEFIAEKTGKAKGLRIFNTTTSCVETWNGEEWISSCAPLCAPITGTASISGNVPEYYVGTTPINFTANVSPAATGVSYQWYKNNIPISGATSQNYNKPIASMADAGAYRVVIGNDCSSLSSNLVVISPDTLRMHLGASGIGHHYVSQDGLTTIPGCTAAGPGCQKFFIHTLMLYFNPDIPSTYAGATVQDVTLVSFPSNWALHAATIIFRPGYRSEMGLFIEFRNFGASTCAGGDAECLSLQWEFTLKFDRYLYRCSSIKPAFGSITTTVVSVTPAP